MAPAAHRAAEAGARVARVLSGAWRASPEEGPSVEAVEAVAPLLLASGAAGLGWWRAQRLPRRRSLAGLRQAFRLQTLRAALREREIARVVALARAAGVEPLTGKGWAIARSYPQPGLRPCGDIDLYVPVPEYGEAADALAGEGLVDLHQGFSFLDDRDPRELHAHSRIVAAVDGHVRLFGPEDHLRLLCLHMLGHGAWRPLWLCDVAVALESRGAGFDWDYLLSGDPRRTEWAACALVLAHSLLGASLDGVPERVRSRQLPRWLVPTVLSQWGDPSFRPQGTRTPMALVLRQPKDVLRALRLRWPNGIEATVGVRGPFNALPRLPFQIAECLRRSARFAIHFRGLLQGAH